MAKDHVVASSTLAGSTRKVDRVVRYPPRKRQSRDDRARVRLPNLPPETGRDRAVTIPRAPSKVQILLPRLGLHGLGHGVAEWLIAPVIFGEVAESGLKRSPRKRVVG